MAKKAKTTTNALQLMMDKARQSSAGKAKPTQAAAAADASDTPGRSKYHLFNDRLELPLALAELGRGALEDIIVESSGITLEQV